MVSLYQRRDQAWEGYRRTAIGSPSWEAYRQTAEANRAHLEAVTSRNWARRQQQEAARQQREAAEAERRRAEQAYRYQAALSAQEAQQGAERDAARFQHDDELFERQRAGRLAEQQLAQLQQEKMARMEAGQQEARDVRLGGLEEARDYRLADIQGQRDVSQAGLQEARDVRLDEMEGARDVRLGVMDQATRESQQTFQEEEAAKGRRFDVRKTLFEAGQQAARDTRLEGFAQRRITGQQRFETEQAALEREQQEADIVERMRHETALADMAQRGHEAIQEIIERRQNRMLDARYDQEADLLRTRMDAEKDQIISLGLSEGTLRLPGGVKERLDANEQAATRIASSPYMSEQQREDALKQIQEKNVALRRLAIPIPQEERAQSMEAEKQRLIAELPAGMRAFPWQFDPKSRTLQVARGYKPPEPPLEIPEDPLQELRQRVITDETGQRWIVTPKRGAPPDLKAVPPPKEEKEEKPATPEKRLATAVAFRKEVDERLNERVESAMIALEASSKKKLSEAELNESKRVYADHFRPEVQREVWQRMYPEQGGGAGQAQRPLPSGAPEGSIWLDADTVQFPDGSVHRRKHR